MAWNDEKIALGAVKVSFKKGSSTVVELGYAPDDSEVQFISEETTTKHGAHGVSGALAEVITDETATITLPLYLDLESLSKLAPHKIVAGVEEGTFDVMSTKGKIIEPVQLLVTSLTDETDTILFYKAMPKINFEITMTGEGKALANVTFEIGTDLSTNKMYSFGGTLA